jgi:hypothetical protein
VLYNDSEKWAWWTLGVVALIIAAYGAFVAFLGHGPATVSVFALFALTAFSASSRARVFILVAGNLRESEIAAVFVKALPRIYSILALRSGPFVARITKAGEIAGV